MTTHELMTDAAVLAALGERLAARRLELNLTQAQLAKEAGVSRRTLGRIEAGESTQLTNLIRIVRGLGLLARLDDFLPPPEPSPLEQLQSRGRPRRRASPRAGEAEPSDGSSPADGWTWDDPDETPGNDA
jgi:transcriptional regulator with XRE-family HTH domain